MKPNRVLPLLLASTFAVASMAWAQGPGPGGSAGDPGSSNWRSPDASNTPSVFGTSGIDIATLGWNAFYPDINGTYTSNTGAVGGGYRWTTAGTTFMTAPMPEIPNGALITQIVWYANDSNASSNFTGFLVRYWRESNAGGSPGGDILSTLSTSGSGGDGITFSSLSHTVMRRGDPVGDSLIRVINYVLYTDTAVFDGTVKFGEVRILWRRQVSPAPATATFGDVPTSSPQFRFVEALVQAGITAGCGSGNYCPNDPVTRGQMAVFIAVALGMHWPAF